MLSEISHTEKYKYCIVSHICERTETESNTAVARGWGRGEGEVRKCWSEATDFQ